MNPFVHTAAAFGILSLSGALWMPTAPALANKPATIDTSAVLTPSASEVWQAARNGDSDALNSLLEPSSWSATDLGESLVQSLELLRNNEGLREEHRTEQIEKASTELDENLAA